MQFMGNLIEYIILIIFLQLIQLAGLAVIATIVIKRDLKKYESMVNPIPKEHGQK